jgi:ADP-ribosylglycohydrolase
MEENKRIPTKDGIKGMIYGHCLGDAVGLITEFKHKIDKRRIIYPYFGKIRDWHDGDWTDDSDQMILLMNLISEDDLCATSFARDLKSWVRNGFPELGDTAGFGVGGSISNVVGNDDFEKDPLVVSKKFWEDSGKCIAPNGSLMRTSILSVIPDSKKMIKMSTEISQVTHFDPRCVICCRCLNIILKELLLGTDPALLLDFVRFYGIRYLEGNVAKKNKMEKVRGIPEKWINPKYVKGEEYDYISEFVDCFNIDDPSELKLDELPNIGYVYKCFSCAVFALKIIVLDNLEERPVFISFSSFIVTLAGECGVADTNCAVAGAVLGAYLGYDRLPRKWIKGPPNRKWLNKKIDLLLEKLSIEE